MNRLLPLLLLCSNCFSQSAKDYFFPTEGKNLSVYKTTNLHGNTENGWTTKVYFRNLGDSALITTQSDGASRRNDNVIEPNQIWQQLVKIKDNEILASRVTTRTPNGVETFDTDGDIIFMIPQGMNKKAEWENLGQKGTIIQTHSSEFSKIRVNGKRIKAVKVTTSLKRKRTGEIECFFVESIALKR